MSYDVMVFEGSKAPRTKEEFLEWYDKQTQWGEGHGYDDISVASPKLQSFYKALLESYKTLEECDGSEEDGRCLLSSAIGRDIIYLCFPRGTDIDYYEEIMDLADDYGVGFYDASGGCEVVFADGEIIFDCYWE